MTRPLFVFGIARSGTNLIGRMLNAHPQVALAFDPLLPLFRRLRNRWVLEDGRAELAEFGRPTSPLQDCYGVMQGPALLDLILNGDIALPLGIEERQALRTEITARAAIESPSLADALSGIDGTTYAEFLTAVLAVVARTKPGQDIAWAGVKEVWTLDFLPALARAFPDARFVIIERDPHAILASLEAMGCRDPSQRAHSGSYLRHWRKGVVLGRHFERDPLLAPKILRIRYEDLVCDPTAGAAQICDHLELSLLGKMLHPEQQIDPLSGLPWVRNSSFEATDGRIVSDSVERWKNTLNAVQQRYISFYDGPEMKLAGYSRTADVEIDSEILCMILAADRNPGNWRSDTSNMIADIGLELMRHKLLSIDAEIDPILIRRCFLFEWVISKLKD